MEKKLPDSFVPDRKTKEYPTEIGSQKFSPDDLSIFKAEKTNKLRNHYSQKFEELKKEYDTLIQEMQTNEMLYQAKCNFEPIVGKNYFLYEKNEEKFISLLSPEEWKNKFVYIGMFQLQSDGRWIQKD